MTQSSSSIISADKNIQDDLANAYNFEIAMDAVKEWLPPKGHRAIVKRNLSQDAVKEFPDDFFDFIYVDAGHEYRNVINDLHLWWPKLKTGGMMAGDDFADMHDSFSALDVHQLNNWGVKSAVVQFAKEIGSPFFLTFADRNHRTTAQEPKSEVEWEDDGDIGTDPEFPPKQYRVRTQSMYPAWYLFK